MKFNKNNLFWTAVGLCVASIVMLTPPKSSNVGLDLSLFCFKLALVTLAVWGGMEKNKNE